jgi:putative NADH-flavin reductase
MTKIAIFGASGRTGKLFTELALKDGYRVNVLVRTLSKLEIQHPNLEVIQGDILDPAKVNETVSGTNAVIDVVGPSTGSSPDLQRTATRHILDAMQQNKVNRLLVLASLPFGIMDEKDSATFINKFTMFIAKTLMGAMVQDAREHVDLIKQSALDWTVVRAPGLNSQPSQGKYRVGYLDASTGKSIARADVAAFILDELKSPTYIRQMPLISN